MWGTALAIALQMIPIVETWFGPKQGQAKQDIVLTSVNAVVGAVAPEFTSSPEVQKALINAIVAAVELMKALEAEKALAGVPVIKAAPMPVFGAR